MQVAGLSVLEDGWALGWDGVKLGVVDKGGRWLWWCCGDGGRKK